MVSVQLQEQPCLSYFLVLIAWLFWVRLKNLVH